MGFQELKNPQKSRGVVRGGVVLSKGRKVVCFSLGSSLYQKPDPKYNPHLNLKKLVIDLEAAQNSLDLYQTASGSILRYDAVPAEFLTKIMNLKDGTERIQKAQTKERYASPSKRSRRDRNTPRGKRKPQGANHKTKRHCKRDSSEKS